jgi:hypothetical protein
VVRRVVKIEMFFYSSGGWELSSLGRVTSGGGVDLLLLFRLERGDDGMKRCQKIKRRQ